MDPFEKIERKQEARRRIRAQRERAGRLKTRVVVTSLICFAMLWGVVFVQMATGNDPVLGDSSSTVTASRRSGTGSRSRSTAKAIPSETDPRTNSEEAVTGSAATEPTEPTEAEPEIVEPEPVEAEVVEPEPEPAPVTTSQS